MTIYEIAALLVVAAMFAVLHWDVFGSWVARRRLRGERYDNINIPTHHNCRCIIPEWFPGGALPHGSLSFVYYRTHDGQESQWPIRADRLDWYYVSHFRFAKPEEVSRMAAVNALEKMERA